MPAQALTAFLSAARRRLPLDTLWRIALWLAFAGYVVFLLLFLLVRYVVLPNVENYRGDIERVLSQSLAQEVSIESIDTGWRGLRPRLSLHGFRIRAPDGRPALSFDRVDAVVAWSSLVRMDLRLYRLSIAAPTLNLRRDAAGKLYIGELQLNTGGQGPDFSDWLLSQRQVVVRDATITWQDEMRRAPPLALQHLNFRLESRGDRHRFGLTAEPPREMARRLDVRGDFVGDDLDNLAAWRGEAYAELDYADLAVWRNWVDYPLELPAGQGAVRLWLGIGDKGAAYATADVALGGVELRLAKDLPAFAIQHMSGRLMARRDTGGAIEVGAQKLELATREGVRVAPTDFRLRWTPGAEGVGAGGEFDADALDLDAVVKLAAYLPLDAELRNKLSSYQPHGRLAGLRLGWSPAAAGGLGGYRVQGRFDNLGLAAQGSVPGFSGLSGRIDGSERSGSIELSGRNAAIYLPAVFAEPKLALTSLDASANWQADKDGVTVNLARASFRNADASGELHGSYRIRSGSPGEIDLDGRLGDADARAVWRYMPLVAGADVREFLKKALLAGRAEETTLKLKGDLARFPFADGGGIFQVKGKVQGGSLRYAGDWPQIDDISGNLLFEGKRMLITADKARIFGAALTNVHCEIPDLETRDAVINVSGTASGATGEFLHFLEASPVGGHIDHVTQDFSAVGNGRLELKLALPLARMSESTVDGSFQFDDNRVWMMAGLPPLTEASGRLTFTGESMSLPRIRANFLGAPISLQVSSTPGAGVQAQASGRIDIAGLRRQYDLPLFDYMTGSAPWRMSATMRNHAAELRVDSTLAGIASALPPPFNKNTLETLPLHFERRNGRDVDHDQIRISLGREINALLLRSRSADAMKIDRGLVGVGDWMPLPERGVLLLVHEPKLDFDFWRRAFPSRSDASGKPALPVNALRLRVAEARLFGNQLTELSMNGARSDEGWGVQINSREVAGSLAWRDQGAGRLVARLKRLAIASSGNGAGEGSSVSDELPGLDVEVEQLQLRGREMGRLKLTADNREGRWDAKMEIDNPDGNMSGSGSWTRTVALSHTQMQFKLGTKNVDRLLTRFGYPEAMRRGSATLEGNVDWNASPLSIDYSSLSGNLKVSAQNGQFSKMTDPGAARLLGVLSLQALPRRLSLDFRDIFSEGFAFESIDGEARLQHGVAETNDLTIDGPAAKILMKGKVNLASETADLRVRIQPALSETLAATVGMLASPVAGAVALLAQKLLKDPLGHVFSYEYSMTGPWADLKIDKVAANAPPKRDDAAQSN
jgi:uncharacterized protein (TIGR02099 family)